MASQRVRLTQTDGEIIAEFSGRIVETVTLPAACSSGWTSIISALARYDRPKEVDLEIVEPAAGSYSALPAARLLPQSQLDAGPRFPNMCRTSTAT